MPKTTKAAKTRPERLSLDSPIDAVSGIGTVRVQALQRLGITTVQNALWTLPLRYEQVQHIDIPTDLTPNSIVSVSGVVQSIASRRAFRRRHLHIVEAVLVVEDAPMKVTWFNQPYVTQQLHGGDTVTLTGKVSQGKYGLTLTNPSYERISSSSANSTKIDGASKAANTHAVQTQPRATLAAVYPLTAGVTQKQFRTLIHTILNALDPRTLRDVYSTQFIRRENLMSLAQAIQAVHRPESLEQAREGRMRLFFDRLLVNQLAVRMVKESIADEHSPELRFDTDAVKTFVDSLPFKLTDDQRKAAWGILQDTEQPHPMNRLLIGDVGSGKTVVAAIAALNCVRNGYQVALMAPTDILAQQHAQTFAKLFTDTDVRVRLVTSTTQRAEGEAMRSKAFTEDILIGTHALIQQQVRFRRLGLAIVDEQHRFGVLQRKQLIQHAELSGLSPHFLSMSATPIPRTLALSLYGDVAISRIVEMPTGRKPVVTEIIQSEAEKERVYRFIRERTAKGEQCFVLCPLIEDSDKLSAASVESVAAELTQHPALAGLRIEPLHGRMKPAEKDVVMADMKNKRIDVLVSTTVIEVGVDIPDATIMLIVNAERFGLAQLHQLRGRVGRSNKQSYCYAFTEGTSQLTRERLAAFAEHHNGFTLAEMDLKIRGAGDVYGIKQSGISDELLLAFEHPDILERAHALAAEFLANNAKQLKALPDVQKRVEEHMARLHFE